MNLNAVIVHGTGDVGGDQTGTVRGIERQGETQGALDFIERHSGVHVRGSAGSDQVVHGSGDQDLRLRRMQLGIGQRNFVLLYRERQPQIQVEGWIGAGPDVQRGDIDFTGVAGSQCVVSQ